jgi:lipopolysaccharide/colanic/teichoic acid biosynthesis glycosyltransferase
MALLEVKLMQRLLDIVFSGLSIIALTPVLLSIMAILRFTGEREIFFRQARIGKNKVSFGLIKFVTMIKNSESLGTGAITLKDDFRVLPFGKFLRKTKLNELPQIFNIFLGHMSIIGPRPLVKKQFSFYSEESQRIIASVMPGLSGVGSIIFRDEEKILQSSNDPHKTYQELITPRKAQLEVWYVQNNSVKLYFKLILLTAVAVLFSNMDMERFFRDLEE